jgi:hypothetical protein
VEAALSALLTPLSRQVGLSLLFDMVCMLVLAYAVYYRRHRRGDLVLSYVAVNLGVFCVGVLIVEQTKVGVAFGFGLFAILSIIRLRSDPISPEESAYYFVALVLGLVNGMQFHDLDLTRLLSFAIVAVMLLLDNRVMLPRGRRRLVTLDVVHPTEALLVADLESRLGGKVRRHFVREVDYVRDITVVDVRYAPPGRARRTFTQDRDLHEVLR